MGHSLASWTAWCCSRGRRARPVVLGPLHFRSDESVPDAAEKRMIRTIDAQMQNDIAPNRCALAWLSHEGSGTRRLLRRPQRGTKAALSVMQSNYVWRVFPMTGA